MSNKTVFYDVSHRNGNKLNPLTRIYWSARERTSSHCGPEWVAGSRLPNKIGQDK